MSNTYPSVDEMTEYTKAYAKHGLIYHPVVDKKPIQTGWQKNSMPTAPAPGQNVGYKTGTKRKQYWVAAIDLDFPLHDTTAVILRAFIVKLLTEKFGPQVCIQTGGGHKGLHVLVDLDKPTKKIHRAVVLFHKVEPLRCDIDLLCQNSNGEYMQVVAPPSVVEGRYFFRDFDTADEALKHVPVIKCDELVQFFNSKELADVMHLASLSSFLQKLRKAGSVNGFDLDCALASFLLQTGHDDLADFAFKIAYADQYDATLTDDILARTRDRLDAGEPVVTVGSLVEKLESTDDRGLLKKLLKAVEAGKKPHVEELQVSAVSRPLFGRGSEAAPSAPVLQAVDLNKLVSAGNKTNWLTDGVLPRHISVILHAFAGSGKTSVIFQLAEIVIRGGGSVVYFELEGKSGDIPEKLRNFQGDIGRLHVVRPTQFFDLFNAQHRQESERYLSSRLEGESTALIIFDSLMAATGGVLTDAKVGSTLLWMNSLAARFGTVITVHHNNKRDDTTGQGRIFGSALISGAVVLAYEVQTENQQCAFSRTLKVSKTNLIELPLDHEVVVGQYPGRPAAVFRAVDGEPVDPGVDDDLPECRERLLELFQQKPLQTEDDILKAFDDSMSRQTIRLALSQIGAILPEGEGEHVHLPKNAVIWKLYNSNN